MVQSPLTGVVEEVVAPAGATVGAGAVVLVVESMKMHHEVLAPEAGVVRSLTVAEGDQVVEGQPLFAVDPASTQVDGGWPRPSGLTDAGAREELERVLARRRGILDEGRAEAVERRHAAGRRTARENVADLVDPGTFSEYGGLAIAAQRLRRPEEELVQKTPADGMVCGTAQVGGV